MPDLTHDPLDIEVVGQQSDRDVGPSEATPRSEHATSPAGMARNLLKAWPALCTFATHEEVTPTNNYAEHGLFAYLTHALTAHAHPTTLLA
jgi:hypothetical protein